MFSVEAILLQLQKLENYHISLSFFYILLAEGTDYDIKCLSFLNSHWQ